jgi:hypothetical protein
MDKCKEANRLLKDAMDRGFRCWHVGRRTGGLDKPSHHPFPLKHDNRNADTDEIRDQIVEHHESGVEAKIGKWWMKLDTVDVELARTNGRTAQLISLAVR